MSAVDSLTTWMTTSRSDVLMNLRLTAVLIGAVLASCSSLPNAQMVPPAGVALILLQDESRPFCGRCETSTIVAMSDGRLWVVRGYWAGHYSDWRSTHKRLPVSAAQFDLLTQKLAPLRAKGDVFVDEKQQCSPDQGGLTVRWHDASGTDSFHYDFGCDNQLNRETVNALRAVRHILGIEREKVSWGFTGK
jgi:hypothetical protein